MIGDYFFVCRLLHTNSAWVSNAFICFDTNCFDCLVADKKIILYATLYGIVANFYLILFVFKNRERNWQNCKQ